MTAVAEKLKRSIREGRAMHGYLICGTDPKAAEELMLECAALLLFGDERTEALSLSPDFFLLDGTVRIDDIREIRREVNKTTFSSVNRVVLIKNAHLLNDFSINAMLKMLEEPPEGTFFFLSGIEQRIIPTIRSRCMTIRLGSGSMADAVSALKASGAASADAERYAAMANGDSRTALKLLSDESFRKLRETSVKSFLSALAGNLPFAYSKDLNKDRVSAAASIEFMLNACHDMLCIKAGVSLNGSLTAPDFETRISELSESFTFSSIRSIINVLTDACERLNSNAGVTPILDRMIVELNGIA
jgi:DNA polymerase III, gamma/tau subunits